MNTTRIGLLLLFALFLVSCSSEDGSVPYEPEYIWFVTPVHSNISDTYYTDNPTINIGGGSYIPSTAECTGFYGTLGPDYLVTWHNSANNTSGTADVGLGCILFVVAFWDVYNIPLEMGANEITVRVVDPVDGVDDTSTMTIYRLPDTTPPEVISTSPSENATNISVSSTITATFNEPMDANSLNTSAFIIKDELQNSISGSVSYSTWSGYTATFTPDSPLSYSTTYTATITTGAQDYQGSNGLDADYSWSFTTRSNPDVTPPTIINTTPVQNSYCAAINSPITAAFDEPIDPATFNSNSVFLQDASGNPVASTLSHRFSSVSLQPQTNLSYNSAYSASFTQALADYAGNTLAADYVLNFSTVANGGGGNWANTSTNGAPTHLNTPVAVWTGDRMVVWGLEISYDWSLSVWNNIANGGAYNPLTDSWSELSAVNKPAGKLNISAVWTGTEMIIWGGNLHGSVSDGGAAYNPSTDSWRTISKVDAPSARHFHNAVWTGSEMIIWGGTNGSTAFSDGARYNPTTDSWRPMSNTNAPVHTDLYTNNRSMLWTGTEAILWNSWQPGQSALYNPSTDSWKPVTTVNAPSQFISHRAVWTGTEMLVWGESSISNQIGVRYDPVTDSWSNMSMICGLESRSDMEVVWTGTHMVIWGGSINNGAMYSPTTDTWNMMNITNAPVQRREHTMVRTGSEIIIWGGLTPSNDRLNSGGRFLTD